MLRRRILAPLAALALTGAAVVVLPMAAAEAAVCTAPAWSSTAIYTGGFMPSNPQVRVNSKSRG